MFSIIRDAMLSGAVYASLEIQAYLNGDMTLDELNRLYFQLLSAADLDPYGGGVAYGWYQIPHLFQSPCYYVSYVTSAVSALELLVLSQEDYDRATEIYWDLLTQTDVFGYQAAVEQAGLTNFLAEPEALTELAAALEDYVCHEIWQVGPFSDLPEDHWARSSVLAAAASEYLTGGADGAFGPDRTLTGAELDAALDVLLEEDGNWGIAPEKAVTREELIQAVYDCAQVLGLDTSARADLSGFADAGEVSPEAGDTVAWAVAEGVLNGTGARTLTPHAPATRAQAATVLMRFWEELCAD